MFFILNESIFPLLGPKQQMNDRSESEKLLIRTRRVFGAQQELFVGGFGNDRGINCLRSCELYEHMSTMMSKD